MYDHRLMTTPAQMKWLTVAGVKLERRALFAAKLEYQRHDVPLDLVANFAVALVREADRVGNIPLQYALSRAGGKFLAAHIDRQVETRAAELPDGLGKVIAYVDVPFEHGAPGIGSDAHCRREPGAGRNHHVCAVRACEAFRHLAPA